MKELLKQPEGAEEMTDRERLELFLFDNVSPNASVALVSLLSDNEIKRLIAQTAYLRAVYKVGYNTTAVVTTLAGELCVSTATIYRWVSDRSERYREFRDELYPPLDES